MKVDLRSPHSIIDKFVSLLAITHRINSEKDFEELLNLITAEAAKLIDAERATIFLLDKATGQLWARTALGLSETIRFDARLGIAGAVLISGKNMIVEDAYKSPLFNQTIDSLTGFQTRNVLSVPLRNIRREIIGVFRSSIRRMEDSLPKMSNSSRRWRCTRPLLSRTLAPCRTWKLASRG
jgi:adenylate cyclase